MAAPVQLPDRHRAHRAAWPVNGLPTGVPVAASHTRTVAVVAAGDHDGAAVQLPDRHRGHPVGRGR